MGLYCEDLKYILCATVVIPTFPVSIPYLFFIDIMSDAIYPNLFWVPPWIRRRESRRESRKQEEQKREAYEKTYAYRYSLNMQTTSG